jgi:histidinol-phosphate aminotransferase
MAYQLNEKIAGLEPYEPLSGDFRIRLDANESFLPLPRAVKQEITSRIESIPFHRYPDPTARELCAAFATFYGVDPALVTAGNGSDELISVIMNAFLMKGDVVVSLEPDFSMYHFYASLSEVENAVFAKPGDLTLNIDQLIEFCTQRNARMLIFSNPCNPTSLGISREEIRRLIRSVKALVVLDEAYMDFWDQSLLQEVEEYDNLLILRTSSKAVGGAGIRLGFAVANTRITNALRAVKSPYNVNAITQMVGTTLFRHGDDLRKALQEILFSRDFLYQELCAIAKTDSLNMRVFPTVTNFVLLWSNQSLQIFEYLLKNGVSIRRLGDYLRITAGEEEENREFIRLLKSFLKGESGQ